MLPRSDSSSFLVARIPSGSLSRLAFVLDADEAVIAGVGDDLHDPGVVELGLLARLVEIVALGRDPLGIGHHPGDGVVDVDRVLAVLPGESCRSRGACRRSACPTAFIRAIRASGLLDGPPWFSQMIEIPFFAPYSVEHAAGLGDGADVGRAVVLPGVDPDRVAAERRRGVDPLLVVLDGLRPLASSSGAQVALAVDHDQDAGDADVVGALLQVLEVGRVVGLVLEELVDELDPLDAVVLAGDLGEVEVVDLLGEQGLVQRPLGQRDLEVADLAGRGLAGSSAATATREPRPSRAPLATVPSRNRRRLMLASLIGPVSLLEITRSDHDAEKPESYPAGRINTRIVMGSSRVQTAVQKAHAFG